MHNGNVMLKTAQGESVTVMLHDAKLWLEDANGGKAAITIADVMQSNGVIACHRYGADAELTSNGLGERASERSPWVGSGSANAIYRLNDIRAQTTT